VGSEHTAGDSALVLAARESFQLATVNPSRAWELAAQIGIEARRAKDWAAVSVASHTVGVAAKQLDDLNTSSSALRNAIRAGQRAGSASMAAEARVSLSGTLSLMGRPGQALRAVAAAIDALHGVAAAKARTQQAAILQLIGRDEEALAALRLALPTLKRAGEADWATRALSNRSLMYIAHRSFRAAEADLLTAQRLCEAHGPLTWAAYIEQNLGWLKASRGEVVAALDHYERAEEKYRNLGAEVGSLREAKGRLLLSVRLVTEARTAAESAVQIHQKQQRHLEVVDAQLLLSTVALVQGDHLAAKEAANQALRGFRRLNRPSGIALARYARLQADFASQPEQITPAQARRSADELARAGWLVPSLEARILAGRLALARGHRANAKRDLAQAARARFTGPADSRARAWLAEALLREAEGRRRSAKSAISAGLRIVENYQATLGATELRAHVSIHRGALAATGLRMGLEDANARAVLSFVERGRASALLLRPPRPPDDPILSADLEDLRTTITEIADRRSTGKSTGELLKRQVRLERAIADRCRRFPAAAGNQKAGGRQISELIMALDRTALIEYIELNDLLYAVTLVNGKARLNQLGSPGQMKQNLLQLSFALRRIANPQASPESTAAATLVLRELKGRFDELLFRPLRQQIGDRPLVLVPSISLQALPWSVVPTCAARPVTVVPSARLWLSASERRQPTAGQRVTIVAGPGLPGANAEAKAVAALYPGALQLIDGNGETASVLAAMDDAAMVHIAAHGLLRSDNPFFSSLLLADGPLTLYELERLHRAPYHVVLASCDAASPRVIAIDEVLGLATLLLAQGTASLIAPMTAVLDEAIVDLMVAYHRGIRAGYAPAEALAIAQEKAAADGDTSWAAAASFVCIGAGHRALGVF
jgi:tetratricopeptide (TPR) repeat protein